MRPESPRLLMLLLLLPLIVTMTMALVNGTKGKESDNNNNNNKKYINNNNSNSSINDDNNNRKGRGKKGILRGTQWWTLANMGERTNDLRMSVTQLFNNPRLLPLTKRQRKLIMRNPGAIVAVAKGAKMATDECQYQFRNRRWNCPTYWDGHGASVFGKILQKGSRETAFIYAITSAAVTHTIARACSEGSMPTCTCDYEYRERPPGGHNWEWSGCSDNVKFGNRFSRRFVDVVEKGRDFRYMMNLHNNEVGRVHVKKEMKKECKCHGMSGSCTIKTCWMRLPTFRQVGDILKDRFDGATKVLPGNKGNMRESNGSMTKKRRVFRFHPADTNHKKPGRKDLVYFENSPNFCEQDSADGFQGTRGRECNASSIGMDGCDLMCCGRGFKSESYVVRERCSCIFHWCCRVTCQVCSRTEVRNTCN